MSLAQALLSTPFADSLIEPDRHRIELDRLEVGERVAIQLAWERCRLMADVLIDLERLITIAAHLSR